MAFRTSCQSWPTPPLRVETELAVAKYPSHPTNSVLFQTRTHAGTCELPHVPPSPTFTPSRELSSIGPHHNDTCQHVEVFGLEAWESNAGRIRSTCQSEKILNLAQFKQNFIKGVEEVKQLSLHDIFFSSRLGTVLADYRYELRLLFKFYNSARPLNLVYVCILHSNVKCLEYQLFTFKRLKCSNG